MTKNKNDNLIKKTCKELGLTYREIGERIGYSESALNNASRQDKISEPLTFAINLFLETIELKKQLKQFELLKEIIRDISKKFSPQCF